MRKLVQFNEDGYCMEIDAVKLERVAQAFKAWLMTIDPQNDPFGFLKEALHLVEAALQGPLPLPFRGIRPHSKAWGEGWLPLTYTEISAPFYITIRGVERSIETVLKDGKRLHGPTSKSPCEARSSRSAVPPRPVPFKASTCAPSWTIGRRWCPTQAGTRSTSPRPTARCCRRTTST